METVDNFKLIQSECLEIFIKKNKDYGDAFATHGVIGVLIRINDKLSRYTNITKNGIKINVSEETLKDTLMDLHNYAAMAILCMKSS
jgi:hypothetical protein